MCRDEVEADEEVRAARVSHFRPGVHYVMPDVPQPSWDQAFAETLIGCEVIIGVTHVTQQSTWHEQIFGTIESVDSEQGIAIRLSGKRAGGVHWLPPDLRSFWEKAPPGAYRLRSTGEVVIDPDFTTTWTVNHAPTSH